MDWNAPEFNKRLSEAIRAFDKSTTTSLCQELINHLWSSPDPYSETEAKRVLLMLRRKRYFALMQEVAEALIQTGLHSPQVYRQYAQALLDLNYLTAAISVLERLIEETQDIPAEHAEARGLMGRAYKQLYINASRSGSRSNGQYLARAIQSYYGCYAEYALYWHGINAAALLHRALRDSIAIDSHPDAATVAKQISESILAQIDDLHLDNQADTWAFATAVEACVALDRTVGAMDWLARYVAAPYTDAFELAGTLRQLTEVWQLDMKSEMGRNILPVLRAELLKREGGAVEIKADDVKAEKLGDAKKARNFERQFGADSYVNFQWYQTGIERCRAVACICKESGEGFGTGFLINGKDLHESLGEELLLLTNAHVVSDDLEVEGALRSDEAFVAFEALGLSNITIKELLWSSLPLELDATLLRLNQPVGGVEPYPLAPRLPLADGLQRIYIVGHPRGGKLSFSLHDNLLLDHQSPRIHYRTPTEGGSSGSPVFNQQWRLIGIHHLGDAHMPRLNGQPGIYEANEGIWIVAIREALAKKFSAG
jgi:hypothetical protein